MNTPADPDQPEDADAAEERGMALMAEASARIIEAVERLGARWVVRVVESVLDAWGQLDAIARETALEHARAAGIQAAARATAELRALFARDPADQRTTPLEVVRTLRAEATEILRRAGVPEVARDVFEVRSFPDDIYGIVPRSLGDLDPTDEELAPTLLAWGVGKSIVLRARALRADLGKG
jgi:hypothetical protein